MKPYSTSQTCPYCVQSIKELSGDHVFPAFLGGSRKIPACKQCNEVLGSTLEADASKILHPLNIVVNSWGLPIKVEGPLWRNAHEWNGKVVDLRIGPDSPIMTDSAPQVPPMEKGKRLSAQFRTEAEAKKFLRETRKKHKLSDVEIKVDIQTIKNPNLAFGLSLGSAIRQLSAKMCIALSRVGATLRDSEMNYARAVLDSEPETKLRIWAAFSDYPALDELRRPLCHTIYIERGKDKVYGIVQFFGAFQFHCSLGLPDSTEARKAFLATLDPTNGEERFSEITPLRIPQPQEFYGVSDAEAAIGRWLTKFGKNAVERGGDQAAAKTFCSEIRVTPRPVVWRSSTNQWLSSPTTQPKPRGGISDEEE